MNASKRQFLFAHLGASSGGWQGLHDRVPAALAHWPQARLVGAFMGLFGLSNQSLFVLLSVPDEPDAPAALRACLPADITVFELLALRATVRPHDDAPITRAGVYVFRFFDVRTPDMAEVAALSQAGWDTFERGEHYATEPMGLFRSADATAPAGRMLLLTWYDNFTSWERSRTPHPDATANFRRRLALTQSVVAYATRLAG